MANALELKVVLLGHSNVGKTCIVRRAVSDVFNPNTESTLGATYSSKVVNTGTTDVRLQIWDTAGQEKYRGMAPMYFRDANAAVLTYSITDKESFDGIDEWVASLREHAGPNVLMTIIGNKSDLADSRVVQQSDGEAKAAKYGAQFREVSAKKGEGISDVFVEIARLCLSKGVKAGNDESLQIKSEGDSPKKNGKCCG